MPEEEDDDGKKEGKDKKAGKDDKKGGKDDKKGGKDDKKGGKEDKKSKEKSPKSPKSPSKGSTKGSPKAEKKASKDKAEKSEKSEPSEKSEEPKAKSSEKAAKKQIDPYKAPPPSEAMLKAMAETGPVFAERFYNDSYEDEQGGRNYVEVQRYERRSGTSINEGAECAPRGGQAFYTDGPPPRPPHPPDFDEYYDDRHRSRHDRFEQPSMSNHQMYFDDVCNVSHRQEASFYDYQDMPPAGPVSLQEPLRPIVLPPTTIVVNMNEGSPSSRRVNDSSALVGARSSGYDMPRRQQSLRASLRSHEELRTPQRRQLSDLHVRKPPPMTTSLSQQLRPTVRQNQRPMDDHVASSTQGAIYESSEPSELSEQHVERFQRLQRPGLRPSGPYSGAVTPMYPPRLSSPGMRAHPPAMMRSPVGLGSRGYLPRVPSGPVRMTSPRMPVQYQQRWQTSSGPSSALTPAWNRRDDDDMNQFPERSLIMLLAFLFVFSLVVVILAISGMNIPKLAKSKHS